MDAVLYSVHNISGCHFSIRMEGLRQKFANKYGIFFIFLSSLQQNLHFLLMTFCSKMALKIRPKMGYLAETLAKMPLFHGLALAGAASWNQLY